MFIHASLNFLTVKVKIGFKEYEVNVLVYCECYKMQCKHEDD